MFPDLPVAGALPFVPGSRATRRGEREETSGRSAIAATTPRRERRGEREITGWSWTGKDREAIVLYDFGSRKNGAVGSDRRGRVVDSRETARPRPNDDECDDETIPPNAKMLAPETAADGCDEGENGRAVAVE